MSTTRAAHRYAKAILEIAQEQNAFDQVTEDFRTIRYAIDHSSDLRNLLATPVIDVRVKERILGEIFRGKVGPVMERFLVLLTAKGRATDLSAIADAYQHLLDKSQNVVPATIMTAIPLDDAQRQMIEERVRTLSGHSVRASYVVDSSLIGGFRVRFEDTMIDASIRHQLERLHESLIGGSLN